MGCRSLLLAAEIVFLALVRITSRSLVTRRISMWGGCQVLTFFDFLSWCVFLCHGSMNFLSAARLRAHGLRFWLHTTVACTCETLHQDARGLSRRSYTQFFGVLRSSLRCSEDRPGELWRGAPLVHALFLNFEPSFICLACVSQLTLLMLGSC